MLRTLVGLVGVSVMVAGCEMKSPTSPAPPGSTPAAVAASRPPATYDFYDCVGPAGTPSTFTAVKTAVPPQTGHPVSAAAAFRFVDDSAVFIVLSFGAGGFSPPGIDVSGNANTTCSVAIDGEVWAFSGVLAPR